MTPSPSERVKNFPTLTYTNVLVPSEQNKAAAAHVMGKCIVAFEFHCWNFSRGPGSSVTSRLPHNLTAVRQVMVSGRSRFTTSTVSVTVVCRPITIYIPSSCWYVLKSIDTWKVSLVNQSLPYQNHDVKNLNCWKGLFLVKIYEISNWLVQSCPHFSG